MLFLLRWHQQSLNKASVNITQSLTKQCSSILQMMPGRLVRASGTTSPGVKGWKVMWKLRPREMSWFQAWFPSLHLLLCESMWKAGFRGVAHLMCASELVFWCRSFQRLKADVFEVFLTPAYDDGNLIERKRALELLLLTKRYIYLKRILEMPSCSVSCVTASQQNRHMNNSISWLKLFNQQLKYKSSVEWEIIDSYLDMP